MMQWIRSNPLFLLICLILLIFFTADGIHVINYPPTSVHQWRQSDCFAYARNYFSKNSGLFEPSFYNLIVTQGRSISELPIYYYVAAKLFHFFGVHYWVLRGLTFLTYIVGLIYLYRCLLFWIKDPIVAMFPVFLLASAPYYYYYAVNFLPNVPAISFSFIAFYYMLLYERTEAKKHLLLSTVLFIFATLLKPTDGGLIWLAYLCVQAKEFVFNKRRDKKLLYTFISAGLIGGGIYGWFRYASWYNAINLNNMNLLGIYPIWDMSKVDILNSLGSRIGGVWLDSYQHRVILCFTLIMLIAYIVKWRKLNNFLKFFTLFLLLGSLSYSILWFKAFGDHDYYQLANVITPTFLCATMVQYYYERLSNSKKPVQYAMYGLLGLLMLTSIYHNSDVQRLRYDEDKGTSYIKRKFYDCEPYLRKIGIAITDIIISLPDVTPNISLTAFGNPGYTDCFENPVFTLSHFQGYGAKYLLITDTVALHNTLYKPYLSKPMGVYNGVYIFDLR